MRLKAFVIFGILYAALLAVCLPLSVMAMRALEWGAANGAGVGIYGFILNMLAFFAALKMATSQKLHDRVGGAAGPTFRAALIDSGSSIAAGIALLATVVDISFYAVGSWYFTGSNLLPSPLRIAGLVGVYVVLAWGGIWARTARNGSYMMR